jgi:hypothetical protein
MILSVFPEARHPIPRNPMEDKVMRKLLITVVAAASVTALGSIAACGAQQATTEREHARVATSIDKTRLGQALIPLEQVRAATGRTNANELQEVGTISDEIHPENGSAMAAPAGTQAELGQAQPLPGVTWSPADCSQMIEAAVVDFTQVDGYTRLFSTRQTTELAGGGVRDGLAANAVMYTPADNVDFDRVRAKIERCKSATVTLDTFGGAVGTITAEEITAPQVEGADRVISWRQTAVFDNLPAEAAGLAVLFNAEATYMTKGDVIVWTSHGGSAGVTSVQLAEPAFRHAMSVLGIK